MAKLIQLKCLQTFHLNILHPTEFIKLHSTITSAKGENAINKQQHQQQRQSSQTSRKEGSEGKPHNKLNNGISRGI